MFKEVEIEEISEPLDYSIEDGLISKKYEVIEQKEIPQLKEIVKDIEVHGYVSTSEQNNSEQHQYLQRKSPNSQKSSLTDNSD